MTPRQSRAARALLGVDLKSACVMSDIGKRTLTEFEAGSRSLNSVTAAKLKGFYITKGIIFDESNPDVETGAIKINACEDRSLYGSENKIEYFDILDVHRSLNILAELRASLLKINKTHNISQSIIIYMMNNWSFSQKSIASIFNFTPSFISAITLRKKNIPLNRAPVIQPYFEDILDVAAALRYEIQIKKNMASMQQCLDESTSIWRALSPSSRRSVIV